MIHYSGVTMGPWTNHRCSSLLLVIGCELTPPQVWGGNDSAAFVLTVPEGAGNLEDTQHSPVSKNNKNTKSHSNDLSVLSGTHVDFHLHVVADMSELKSQWAVALHGWLCQRCLELRVPYSASCFLDPHPLLIDGGVVFFTECQSHRLFLTACRLQPLHPTQHGLQKHTHTKPLSHSAVPQRTDGDVLWNRTRITGRLRTGWFSVLVYRQSWKSLAAVQVHKCCLSWFLRCMSIYLRLFVLSFAVAQTMNTYPVSLFILYAYICPNRAAIWALKGCGWLFFLFPPPLQVYWVSMLCVHAPQVFKPSLSREELFLHPLVLLPPPPVKQPTASNAFFLSYCVYVADV